MVLLYLQISSSIFEALGLELFPHYKQKHAPSKLYKRLVKHTTNSMSIIVTTLTKIESRVPEKQNQTASAQFTVQ